MKKRVVFLVLAVVLLISAAPVSAGSGPVDGPPGWSHVNPGQGGSENPGPGAGG